MNYWEKIRWRSKRWRYYPIWRYNRIQYGPGWQCLYPVEVSVPDLTKIVRLADPLLYKNPCLKGQCHEIFDFRPMLFSGAWGKTIHEKNLKQNISWHCPFKGDDENELRIFSSHIVSLPDPALTEGVLNTNIMLHVVDWLLSHFVYILYVFRLNKKSCGVVYDSSVKCTNCITKPLHLPRRRPQPGPFLWTTSRLLFYCCWLRAKFSADKTSSGVVNLGLFGILRDFTNTFHSDSNGLPKIRRKLIKEKPLTISILFLKKYQKFTSHSILPLSFSSPLRVVRPNFH